ncbi:hypothetical protein FH063_004261 [Azospirillum argentinense]|uniref:Uncharacterized protein n=1 Tax=Azospirillum argentinense TaxID=2970906 RepID=A0A5B0KNL9_9PROT|nr:hypothetical protein FH063_004261 [Azospirillum argentinense]
MFKKSTWQRIAAVFAGLVAIVSFADAVLTLCQNAALL